MPAKRGHRKELVGIVVSDKMDKTIVVKVVRLARHPRYGKTLTKSKKFKVDDRENKARIGSKVKIVEARPLSKQKRWRLQEILKEQVNE